MDRSSGSVGSDRLRSVFAIASSCLFPDTLLCIIAGAMLGLGVGIPAVLAGSLLAAALQFALSHHLPKKRIEKVLATRPSLAAIQRAVVRDEFPSRSYCVSPR